MTNPTPTPPPTPSITFNSIFPTGPSILCICPLNPSAQFTPVYDTIAEYQHKHGVGPYTENRLLRQKGISPREYGKAVRHAITTDSTLKIILITPDPDKGNTCSFLAGVIDTLNDSDWTMEHYEKDTDTPWILATRNEERP